MSDSYSLVNRFASSRQTPAARNSIGTFSLRTCPSKPNGQLVATGLGEHLLGTLQRGRQFSYFRIETCWPFWRIISTLNHNRFGLVGKITFIQVFVFYVNFAGGLLEKGDRRQGSPCSAKVSLAEIMDSAAATPPSYDS